MTNGPSTLHVDAFDAFSTGTRVEYRALVPADTRADERLPLVIHLHGAMSSSVSLEAARSSYEAAWAAGALPRAIVVCASTPTRGGFYIDHAYGPSWETLVAGELPDAVGRRFALSGQRAIIGYSMGGYGALKIGFRRPDAYAGIAALCPTIFPGETPEGVPEKNRASVLDELHQAMGSTQADYANNSVYHLARANSAALRKSYPALYFDCGDADEFGLHDGARYLHGVLNELAIPHEFRSIPGAGHADAAIASRQEDAIRFIGKCLAMADAG